MFSHASTTQTGLIIFSPRTGSSLLAQTLRLLGQPILGEAESDCKPEANPRGYYDIPDLRNEGWTEANREEYGDQWNGKVVKVLVNPLLKDTADDQWELIHNTNPYIFITYRHPLEQVLSHQDVFLKKQKAGSRKHFIQVTRKLRNWSSNILGLVHKIRTEFPNLVERTTFVGYYEHLEQPKNFCQKLAAHMGLSPTEAQRNAALDNIDDSLYRFRYSDIDEKFKQWYHKFPAQSLYNQLRQNPAGIWDLDAEQQVTAHTP